MKKKLALALFAAMACMSMSSITQAEDDLYGETVVAPWLGCYHGVRKPAIAQDYKNQAIVTTNDQKPTLNKLKKAVAQAAVAQNWDVQIAKAPAGSAKFLLTRVIRNKHTMVVAVTLDNQKYSVEYQSSINLNAAKCQDAIYIHPNYNKWVGDLNSAIKGKLKSL